MTAFAAAPSFLSRARPAPLAVTADAHWDPLMVAVAVYTLTAVGRIHQLFPILGVLRPAFAAALGALVLLALDRRRSRNIAPVLRYGTVRWLILLFGWAVLSIPGALWPGGAFMTVFDKLAKAILMAVITLAAVRGPKDVQRLVFVFFGAVALYAAVVVTRFDVSSATGRLGALYYYDPNDFAVLSVVALPFGAFGIAHARSMLTRLLCLAGLGVIAVAFVWTGSRGGFLALTVTCAFGLLMLRTVKLGWRVVAIVVLAAGLSLVASDQYWKRMDTIVDSDEDYNRTSSSGRLELWRRGLTYMLDRPVLGVGAGNFPRAEGTLSPLAYLQEYSRGVKWSAAHNSFIQVGAELGVPGLLFFITAIVSAFTSVWRARSEVATPDRKMRALADLCAVAYVGFVVGAVFLSLAYHDILYALYGLSMSVVKASRLARLGVA